MKLILKINRFGRLIVNIANFSIRREIAKSGLFDANWYILSHPYLIRDKIDPLTHFIKNGRRHVISPSRKFDTARYLEHYADKIAPNLNPLLHYLKHGRLNGFSIQEAPPSAADRIKSSGLFDDDWYLDTYPDTQKSGLPPLLHYLAHGYAEGKSPGPDFDAAWYLSRYPDIGGSDPLLHYIDHGRAEGRLPMRPTRIQQLANETIESVKDLESELYSTDYFQNVDHIPVAAGPLYHPLSRSFREIIKAIPAPPRAIVFVPSLLQDDADLAVSNVIRALADEYGPRSVIVLATDDDCSYAPRTLSTGVTAISLVTGDEHLSENLRKDLVDVIIRGFEPDLILNIDSLVCWEAYKYFGHHLSRFSRMYAMMFSPDHSEQENRIAYADLYFPHCLKNMEGIYFYGKKYINDLCIKIGVPDQLQKLFVPLYQPVVLHKQSTPKTMKHSRLQVLWVGQPGQKDNKQLLIDIIRDAPQFDFHIWGYNEIDFEGFATSLRGDSGNVQFHGRFERLDELPFSEYDALLHTSLWGGLPNIILEGAAAGLPIVGITVGDLEELVDSSTGWLVSSQTETVPYIEALSNIAESPEQVDARTKEMTRRLERRHSWDHYCQTLRMEPGKTSGLLMPKSTLG